MPENSSNKTIAKNTIMLYIRMLISMLVGLYTSRVVLQTLGVEDYGIYGVVGGVVSMMGFLNTAMSGATGRFITYELAKGNLNRVRETFSTSLIIHCIIAIILILSSETIGLWFLCNKLEIPDGRMTAAHWVFQCSIITAAVNVTQAPYSAVITSHEKFDVYAYFEMLNVLLKLIIVYLLSISDVDKLILYSSLMLAISLFMRGIYRIYCIKYFPESHFCWIWDKKLILPMLSFSGWGLYGVASDAIKSQGTNFIINMFFGVALNAASSIALTVQGLCKGLSYTVTTAISPQVIKNYASGNINKMTSSMLLSVTITGSLMCLFIVPVVLNVDTLMSLWLVEAPEYAPIFCKILMFSGLVGMISSAVFNGIYASGTIKGINFYTGTLQLLSVPCLYFLYLYGASPESAQYLNLVISAIILLMNLLYVKHIIPELPLKKFMITIAKLFVLLAVSFILMTILVASIENPVLAMLLSSIFHVFFFLGIAYLFLLDRDQRFAIKNIIIRKFCQK